MSLPIVGAWEVGDAGQNSILLEDLDISLFIKSSKAWA